MSDSLNSAVGGKKVMVTGASSGIGEALAYKLGDARAILILVARSVEKLEKIKSKIESRGGKAFVYGCDLSDGASTDALIQSVNDAHGTVDILVNNAGISIRRSVAKSYERIHDFERTMALNFFGSLRLILGFVPKMREQKSGRIVNVSTLGVQVGVPRFGAYIASKSALDAFSRILAAEALSDGIRVTTVYMPLVKTPMMASTTMYQSFPMRTASEGADLIIDGIVNDKTRVAMPTGIFFEAAHMIAPRVVDRVLHAGFQLFPESGKKGETSGPKTGDAAKFEKVFKALTRRARRRSKGNQNDQ